MSAVESAKDLAEEAADRIADQIPAWGMPRIWAGLNLRSMLHDARKRVYDSHKLQMESLGGAASELDDMGGTIIARDVTVNTPQKSSKLGAALLSAAAVALGVGTGAGGLAALQWWLDRPEPQVIEQTDWQLGIEVRNEP